MTLVLFSFACKKDDEATNDNNNNNSTLAPSLEFNQTTGLITGDTTLPVNADFTVGINAISMSAQGLIHFKVLHYDSLYSTLLDTVLATVQVFMYQHTYQASAEAGQEKWVFRLSDKNGQEKEISLVINTFSYDPEPAINFIGGSGYVSGDVTLTTGEQFTVGINASCNMISGKKLTNFRAIRTFNSTTYFFMDSVLNDLSNFSVTLTPNANPLDGVETWQFIITDKSGEHNEVGFDITTVIPGGNINVYMAIFMGAQGNVSIGGYYASSTNLVMMQSQAQINQSNIDFVYFYGATNHATFSAPDDPIVGGGLGNLTLCEGWTVKNPTRFLKTTLSTADFDAITNDAAIVAVASYANLSKANMLSVGDVVAFKTAAGKMGLIKVTQIDTGSIGTITFDVKIQQ